jgi:hypothetical protein
MHSSTAIGNYAVKHHGLSYIFLGDDTGPVQIPSPQPSPRGRGSDPSRVGFHGSCPPEDQIAAACRGKLFLNFDDGGFGPPMARFLQKLFPEPCKYEA